MKIHIKSSLGAQLIIIFVIIISISIGVVAYFILKNEGATLKTTLVQNGRDIVENIAGNVADALSQTPVDDTTLVYIIKNTMNRKWVKYVLVTDPDDSLILATDKVIEEWGKRYIPPVLNLDDVEPYFIREGEKIYDIRYSVTTASKKTIGIVHLGLSQKSIDEVIGNATTQVIIIALIILILGTIFSIVLANFLVKPIKLLMDGVAKISAGNYDQEIKVKLRNELDDLTESFNEMARNLKEKELIKVAFSRYMSHELLDEVIKEKGKLHLGGEKRFVTILFSDIRDFTSMAEILDPQEVVKLLNEYFTKMTEVIFENKGVVNKYMGDAIIEIYGAPLTLKDHAKKAVTSALEMYNELNKLKEKWQQEKRAIIGMKIGITSGEVVIGNVGTEKHMEYTVIGDSVNVAARLQALNKNYGTQILISESTYELIKDDFETRRVELVQFKGKTSLTLVYEVLNYKQRET